ncbi:type VI secretion system tube protein Hcp [Aquabacterium sp.]|jgi:type VI secretion system secreted protein Hcp|uniref:Hcp family type VI secretion system effector n=1 Tax=Aquabacterium sp. TaxID=1872578 RepID=UPI0025C3A60B|nr:type VI secretion system tube protein Hcp [Aquabacterium sp.]
MKDIYVVFPTSADIKGDTTDSKHATEKAIEVSTWAHKIYQPKSSTASSAGGHTAERTEHGEMIFTKDIDNASPKLWQASSAGTYYNTVVIYFYRSLGGVNTTSTSNNTGTSKTRVNYLKIELKDVVVSSVTTNVGEGELPTETFGLKYSAVKWTYTTAKVDGTTATGAVGSWNLKKNDTSF